MPTHLYGKAPLLFAALGWATAVTALAHADVATLPDGRRLPGKLTYTDAWRFLPTGKAEPLTVPLHAVRLERVPSTPFRAAVVHRVTLRSGEWLTGVLLDLDGKTLSLRTAWAERIALPRAAVAAVTQQPGSALVFLDDFRDGLGAWKVEGKLDRPSPPHPLPLSPEGRGVRGEGLVLSAPGQAVKHALAAPIREGRAGVNFHDSAEAAGATWLAEAEFRTPAGPRRVTVTLAGAIAVSAVVEGIRGKAARLPRSPGWHRLEVRFAPTCLRVVVDDAVLWHNLEHGPGGPLLRFRLACRKADGQRPRGSLAFKDFALHRAVDQPRRPPGDPRQDEVWLLEGDQLFGRILRANGRSILLEGRFGRRTLPWTLVRGIYLGREASARPGAPAAPVRLSIDNGVDVQPDRLEGTVLSLDERRCRLRHPLLGDIELERGRVSRVQFLPRKKEIRP